MNLFRILICVLSMGMGTSVHAAKCMPYAGETLSFSIGWEFVNAGTAVMTYSDTAEGYRFHTDARTNTFFDVFKKVRDTMISEGVCQQNQMQSTLFALQQLENRYNANKKTEFLWQEDKVAYTQNGQRDLYNVPAGHLNVLDAFTMLRMVDFKQGDTVTIPVFDSRKTYNVIISISPKTKMMTLPSGEKVECLIVEPKLETSGVFSSKGKIKIWMTNDSRHIPVKMTAAIKLGRIVAQLIDYRPAS